ncbi:FAD-dependent monooxygenase [Saccharopolyspora sp. NPDC000359]|uniref:FAD-dependent monooxygenase n=1 Tax=Saccharopolyspora sp. NPDC000359 TaxID=3154251 RepID=UPI00332B27DD
MHGEQRRRFTKDFTVRRVRALRPGIEKLITQLLDEVERAGPPADLVSAFALPDQRGLLSRFGRVETHRRGHFGGLPVDFGVLPGALEATKTIPQARTEQVLEEWCEQLGALVRRGHELLSFTDDGDAVRAEVRTPGGGAQFSARYLVGCDGGRSRVREVGGFAFPGTPATTEMFLADVEGLDLPPRPLGEILPQGMVMVSPLPGGRTRLILGERLAPPRRRTGPPAFAEVVAGWRRVTGQDIAHAEPVWVSSFGDAARLVSEYRRGRVLLAGDACHVHLPAGGQGMNTSIQDAVNLGWKLAAVVQGRAPEALLDTYHDERYPVGQRLITSTRAQGLLGEQAQPLRDVLSELIGYEEVSRHLAAMVSGLEIRYDTGGGDHPLLGYRMPNVELLVPGPAAPHRRSTAELLRSGRGVLLDLADDPALRSSAAAWGDRVDVVTAAPRDGDVLAGTAALLIRPDGHVAWADPGSRDDLPTTLRKWFGPCARQPARGRS